MSLRLFACLDVPPDVADRVVAVQKGVPGARWRPRDNLHITLRFFGDVPEDKADDLDAALDVIGQGMAPFDVQLKGADWFGKDEPRALYLGVADSPPLIRLAQACDRAARSVGLKADPHKFTPHLTVAYLAGSPLDRVVRYAQRLALFESRAFRVEGFYLWSSRVRADAPSLYREEAAYPLLG